MGKCLKTTRTNILLGILILTPLNSYCLNDRNLSLDKELSWLICEDSVIRAFQDIEHILKWAAGPWIYPQSELISGPDNKNVLVVSNNLGSGITYEQFYIFIQSENIYYLFAISDNAVRINGKHLIVMDSGDVLIISDSDGEIGKLEIDFAMMTNGKEIQFLDRNIAKGKEHITAGSIIRKDFDKPYFAVKDYTCVVKGTIEDRIDLEYFDGGWLGSTGGAISALKVKVIEKYGNKDLEDHLWIYPDTCNMVKDVLIWNYGYQVPSGPFYFGLIEKDNKYVYRLDDKNFMIIPELDGSVVGDFNYLDKLRLFPKSRKMRSEKFERKLISHYKHRLLFFLKRAVDK